MALQSFFIYSTHSFLKLNKRGVDYDEALVLDDASVNASYVSLLTLLKGSDKIVFVAVRGASNNS